MKIAYYEENNYHTEIMGTFLEPYQSNCNDITIYNDLDKSDYISWFSKFFNWNIKKNDDFINDYKNFDIVIIGTSTTFKFFDIIDDLDKKKFFYITHLKDSIENFKDYKNIVLTPLNKLYNSIYILPVNNLYKKINKNYKTITIGIVGRFKDSNRNTSDIIKLLNNYPNLNFIIKIFTRHIKFIPKEILNIQKNMPSKIKIYYKWTTEQIINSIDDINYFCPLSSLQSCYVKDRLTGIIPFSFNFNTPLLLDQETNYIYNFKSPIIYNNSLCEIIEQVCSMDLNNYLNLIEQTMTEKNNLCLANYEILKNII